MPGPYALDNFALVAGSSADAHGPVKFDTITFTGPTYASSGVTGLAAGLKAARAAAKAAALVIAPTVDPGIAVDSRVPVAVVGIGGAYTVEYAPSTDKLVIRTTATGAEVSDNTDLHATTFHVCCIST